MADNYLERRMEDHRAGRDNAPARRPGGPRPGWVTMRYPSQTVAVSGTWAEAIESVAAMFVQAGCRVVLIGVNVPDAVEIARRTGARLYPVSEADALADLTRRNELPHTSIVCGPGWEKCVPAPKQLRLGQEYASIETFQIVGGDVEQMARMALMCAHTAASMPEQVIYCGR